MKTKKSEEDEKKRGRKRFWALIIIILLLLLLFLIFQWQMNERNKRLEDEYRQMQFELSVENARRIADSIIRADSARADSAIWEDSLKRLADTEMESYISSFSSGKKGDASRYQKNAEDAQYMKEALEEEPEPLPHHAAAVDSTPPSPSILPPPGRYYKPVNLSVECGEPKCQTEISVDEAKSEVHSKIENYNKTGKVYFRAIDSAGNASHWETASYDMASDNSCSENSYPVPVKGKTVCVDVYEYPNKAGEKPRNMVNQEEASRLCEQAGKKLCSVEEWQAACRGNSNLHYPYGNSYNQKKCATDLKSAKEPGRSGFAEHCRSYYGMYDMSGNLWEWTSTPAQRDGLFLVAGGAWNTQNASSCTETKFSFYPQNEYPFVGFRCCR